MLKLYCLLSLGFVYGLVVGPVAAESSLYSIQISRPSCSCSLPQTTELSEDQLFQLKQVWLNDDRIGDLAISRYGCDCSNCRIAIATKELPNGLN
ncbi:MAG: hypothetical protein SFT94_06730 [Pseudanabaenaceae cyanobacterium bins.68]|nr:hypothetical protein [Pseudanabaenaceae cyanobacterium bins.68]